MHQNKYLKPLQIVEHTPNHFKVIFIQSCVKAVVSPCLWVFSRWPFQGQYAIQILASVSWSRFFFTKTMGFVFTNQLELPWDSKQLTVQNQLSGFTPCPVNNSEQEHANVNYTAYGLSRNENVQQVDLMYHFGYHFCLENYQRINDSKGLYRKPFALCRRHPVLPWSINWNIVPGDTDSVMRETVSLFTHVYVSWFFFSNSETTVQIKALILQIPQESNGWLLLKNISDFVFNSPHVCMITEKSITLWIVERVWIESSTCSNIQMSPVLWLFWGK